MPKVVWSKTGGSRSLPFYTWAQGFKQVPFNPSIKPPMAYETSAIFLGEKYALGRFGRPCGTVFWGEITPFHICTSGFDSTSLQFSAEGKQAYARAYGKFKDKAYTQASNLTALSERAKTIDMVLARLKQLHKGAQALKRGRFKEFLDTFGVRPLKKHKNTRWTRPKRFGALWLEYWMGWAPTIGDVYTSLDALSGRIPDHTIKAGSTVPISGSKTLSSSGAVANSQYLGKGTVWIQGIVEITNPSLHIAQSLGLVNPFKTVWETTPFSWFADWFTNVGQILGQITDWVGLKLKNLIVSVKTVATSSWSCSDARIIYGWSEPATMFHSKSFFWFSRYILTVLPTVKPILRLPNGLSLTRGATLASLLATMFAPSKR